MYQIYIISLSFKAFLPILAFIIRGTIFKIFEKLSFTCECFEKNIFKSSYILPKIGVYIYRGLKSKLN